MCLKKREWHERQADIGSYFRFPYAAIPGPSFEMSRFRPFDFAR